MVLRTLNRSHERHQVVTKPGNTELSDGAGDASLAGPLAELLVGYKTVIVPLFLDGPEDAESKPWTQDVSLSEKTSAL